MCTICVPFAPRGQKRALDSLKLEWQPIVKVGTEPGLCSEPHSVANVLALPCWCFSIGSWGRQGICMAPGGVCGIVCGRHRHTFTQLPSWQLLCFGPLRARCENWMKVDWIWRWWQMLKSFVRNLCIWLCDPSTLEERPAWATWSYPIRKINQKSSCSPLFLSPRPLLFLFFWFVCGRVSKVLQAGLEPLCLTSLWPWECSAWGVQTLWVCCLYVLIFSLTVWHIIDYQ